MKSNNETPPPVSDRVGYPVITSGTTTESTGNVPHPNSTTPSGVTASFGVPSHHDQGTSGVPSLYATVMDDVTTLRVLRRRAKYADVALQSLFIDKFEKRAAETPDEVFMMFEDRSYSYGLMDQWACKVAGVVMSLGVSCDNTVALMMENEPAFVWTFLGRI